MGLSGIVFVQVLIIFVLMAVGFALAKANVIGETGTGQMTNILLQVVTPCVLIKAYQKDFSTESLSGLLAAACLTLVIHAMAIVVCSVVFKKSKNRRVNIFASVYSNCGFMAIPLLSAALGEDGVFFGSAYLAVFTVLYWTHGVCLYGGSLKEISLKRILKNPGIIGTLAALVMFAARIKLPYVISESVNYIAGLNTPLAMIVTGAYLTRVDFKSAVKNAAVYAVTLMRLAVIPALAVILVKIAGIDPLIAKPVLISAACPTASVTALLAEKYRLNSSYAAELVSVTTLVSIASIPIVMMFV